jgi:hypothetical protein
MVDPKLNAPGPMLGDVGEEVNDDDRDIPI